MYVYKCTKSILEGIIERTMMNNIIKTDLNEFNDIDQVTFFADY